MTCFSGRLLKLSVCLLLLMGMSACGFHLRGGGLKTTIERVYVSAAPGSELVTPLKRRLRSLGVQVVGKPAGAPFRLHLIQDDFSQRTVSVTGRALAAEYELALAVHYQILNAQAEVVADNHLDVSRIFRIDQGNLVGTSEEQALLRTEMREDLVQQIIRSLFLEERPQALLQEPQP